MKIKEKLYNYLKIDDFKGNVTSFVEAKIELLRMDVEDRFFDGITKVVYLIVQLLLAFLVAIFGLILLANFLNSWLQSTWQGHGIVLLLCLIPCFLWRFSKEKMMNIIKNKAIKELDNLKSE